MKSKILFIPILIFLLSNSNPCLSQSDTLLIIIPDCCPGENRDEYLQSFHPLNDCSVCPLIDELSYIVESIAILSGISGIRDENEIMQDLTNKINVNVKIGDKMEMDLATEFDYFTDSANNIASSMNYFLSMTFKIDNDHTYRLYSEFLDLYSSKIDTESSGKIAYWIRKNNTDIYYTKSINDIGSPTKIHNEKEVNQLFELLTVYLKSLGCDVEIQPIETTRSGKTEIVNHVCLCAEIAKFAENVKLIE